MTQDFFDGFPPGYDGDIYDGDDPEEAAEAFREAEGWSVAARGELDSREIPDGGIAPDANASSQRAKGNVATDSPTPDRHTPEQAAVSDGFPSPFLFACSGDADRSIEELEAEHVAKIRDDMARYNRFYQLLYGTPSPSTQE